ncbi:hypothetical protein [Aminivibrio sp.]|uniref:hypothetical protein n=1 Tax=Aminivibrio sp. TaxID=1872489 RepID=UPI00345EA865
MTRPDPSSPADPQDDKHAVVLSNAKDLGLPVTLSEAIAEHPEHSEGRIWFCF